MAGKDELRNYNRRYAKEYNFWRSAWYMIFLYGVALPFFSIFYNYKITGKENLPKYKQMLIMMFNVANTSCYTSNIFVFDKLKLFFSS